MNPHHKLRSTLHVQTISHWAPICVGPYSQANTLRSGIIFLAGQIGLVPATMKLVEGGWAKELSQCWKNAASVLDALEGSLKDVLGGVVYICSDIVGGGSESEIWELAQRISRETIKQNGGITAGQIDQRTLNNVEQYGGYEDYETWKEMTASNQSANDGDMNDNDNDDVPLLMVALPQMPKGAVSEVELVCATNKATECLDMENFYSWSLNSSEAKNDDCSSEQTIPTQKGWEMSYGNLNEEKHGPVCNHKENIEIEAVARSIGKGCSVISNVVAYFQTEAPGRAPKCVPLNLISLLQDMMNSGINSIEGKSQLDISSTLHIRLFYVNSSAHDCGFDASALQCALQSVITWKWKSGSAKNMMDVNHLPACSVVPVSAIFMSPVSSSQTVRDKSILLGMQIIAFDLIHLQTEMWLHSNRTYN
mmetsp:Transcript_10380/g.15624  ORF Transcript_10380/g.15624 Transcript_10380/m.15624 type:complete len:422 (+) Transcript_10380:608-1873(+)